MRALSGEALRAVTVDLRRRLAEGADLAVLLPEAFAAVREAARRTIDQRLVDEQIMGGVALHLGALAEMKTGEGKTLAITLPAYLNALGGQGVHVITANDYLAARDAEWMGPVYRALGLECGLVGGVGWKGGRAGRRAAYAADVTYGTTYWMACDYLGDNQAGRAEELVQRGRRFVIVDEADLILIDEARRELRLLESVPDSAKPLAAVAELAEELVRDREYTVDEYRKLVTLTEAGIERAEVRFGVADFYASAESGRLRSLLEDALKAKEVYRRDRDYVVLDGAIGLVDVRSGRLGERGAYERGLAQAIEVKEGLSVQPDVTVVASISVREYLRRYERLAAVTGVAAEAEGYREIYGLETVLIPAHRPVLRVDRPMAIYRTDAARLGAVVCAVAAKRAAGRPVLVGAGSIAQSEEVSAALTERGIPHEVINAKNHHAEARIMAEAGRVGAITVVTRMAGRGVDIRLGGDDPEEHEAVVRSGGLYVLALEVYETRRLELHMRGRAGRRGDPGESDMFLSCEDATLMDLVGAKTVKQFAGTALVSGLPKPGNLGDRSFTWALVANLDERTGHLLRQLVDGLAFDSVVGERREEIYRLRRGLLTGSLEAADWVRRSIDEVVDRHVGAAIRGGADLEKLHAALGILYPVGVTAAAMAQSPREVLGENLRADAQRAYDRRRSGLGAASAAELERRIPVAAIDRCWPDFLAQAKDLAAEVVLHALTGADCNLRYRQDCARMFAGLLERIQEESVGRLFDFTVELAQDEPAAADVDVDQ
jgi:preprotein translocase subunit SecA